jgi:hypothetical protein
LTKALPALKRIKKTLQERERRPYFYIGKKLLGPSSLQEKTVPYLKEMKLSKQSTYALIYRKLMNY